MEKLDITIYLPSGKTVSYISTNWDSSGGNLYFEDQNGDEYLTTLPYFAKAK